MAKIKDITVEELEYLIEQKILEVLGDPDSGLELREEFKEELKRRLENPSKRISHEEVVKKFG
jgi:predicted PP-loop superfamily ATPase